jgi:hypothetical protein
MLNVCSYLYLNYFSAYFHFQYTNIQHIYTTLIQINVCILPIWPFYTMSAVHKSGQFGFMLYCFGLIP